MDLKDSSVADASWEACRFGRARGRRQLWRLFSRSTPSIFARRCDARLENIRMISLRVDWCIGLTLHSHIGAERGENRHSAVVWASCRPGESLTGDAIAFRLPFRRNTLRQTDKAWISPVLPMFPLKRRGHQKQGLVPCAARSREKRDFSDEACAIFLLNLAISDLR